MFRRLGADVTTKQLNSNKQALSIAIINELINNNVDISNDDLHIFIDLFLRRKQNSGKTVLSFAPQISTVFDKIYYLS